MDINYKLFEAVILAENKLPRGSFTVFINFLLWWIVMEEYLKSMSQTDNAKKAIIAVSNNLDYTKKIQNGWSKISYKNWFGYVNLLHTHQPVRFRNSQYNISNTNSPDLIELLNFIYAIRGNLIHGTDDLWIQKRICLYTLPVPIYLHNG